MREAIARLIAARQRHIDALHKMWSILMDVADGLWPHPSGGRSPHLFLRFPTELSYCWSAHVRRMFQPWDIDVSPHSQTLRAMADGWSCNANAGAKAAGGAHNGDGAARECPTIPSTKCADAGSVCGGRL